MGRAPEQLGRESGVAGERELVPGKGQSPDSQGEEGSRASEQGQTQRDPEWASASATEGRREAFGRGAGRGEGEKKLEGRKEGLEPEPKLEPELGIGPTQPAEQRHVPGHLLLEPSEGELLHPFPEEGIRGRMGRG